MARSNEPPTTVSSPPLAARPIRRLVARKATACLPTSWPARKTDLPAKLPHSLTERNHPCQLAPIGSAVYHFLWPPCKRNDMRWRPRESLSPRSDHAIGSNSSYVTQSHGRTCIQAEGKESEPEVLFTADAIERCQRRSRLRSHISEASIFPAGAPMRAHPVRTGIIPKMPT